ncbi:ArnT family glycosyltransferase [Schleiferilactobacillus perolens]|jgi:4-amino-4-deoxy-L-arabinose transferase-like glycosyltransferase|uniref:ArnT family glycosyltransferase n=1 Tax=Schleiferilactobacillus perolens TaxID=100468 RepID=UPI002353C8C8|nr:glycosyltransferase family 39 protein [Schleiferilactobacillus perolens]MCI2170707.1 glycosyltransferase family 39 protein [Schleiferilactobacillus perolens]
MQAKTKPTVTEPPVKKRWSMDIWLIAILILAAFLYGWNIWQAGNANDYYTAAIVSMTKSWHNFWYGAFDPAGFITVDKPPVALWFMAISAKIFGVHGWSVVLPSILFGIGSVYLLYAMVKRPFGAWAGRLAALIMTLTPIVVADSRTNNMDATLVYFLLLATDCLFIAIAKKKPWLVIVSFALIGVAFNIKMLQAFMILPALILFYWLASSATWPKRLLTLGGATAACAVFTLAWPLQVDSTNAADRPYIGSSQTNSVMELAFGYNGTERLLGQSTGTGGAFGAGMTGKTNSQQEGMPGSMGTTKSGTTTKKSTGKTTTTQGQMPGGGNPPSGTPKGGNPPTGAKGQNPPGQAANGTATNKTTTKGSTTVTANGATTGQKAEGGFPGGTPPTGSRKGGFGGSNRRGRTGGGGGAFNIGTVGVFRIFQTELGPQISWLLPTALIGFVSAFAYYFDRKRKWWQLTLQQKHLGYWLAWLVPVGGFFSIASFFHPYYTIMLAPPIAALGGIGLYTMFKQFSGSWKKWTTYLLPLAIAATVALQAWYLTLYYTIAPWLLIIAGLVVIAGLLATRLRRFRKTMVGATLITILAAPGFWSLTPTLAAESAGIPTAGPDLLSQGGNASGGIGSGSVNSGMLKYLEKHQGSAKYLFATSNASTAAPYIIKSGKAVMAIGGFNGTDPTLTLKQFKALVKKGEIKYYYSSGRAGNSTITTWIEKVGKKVSSSKYSSGSTKTTNQRSFGGGMPGGMGDSGTLYQLSPSDVK